MLKTFSVFERVIKIESDEHGKYQRVTRQGIARNLSWQEAKDLRKTNRQYTIIPE